MAIGIEAHLGKSINLQFAVAETEKVIRQSSKTFHFATQLLPPPARVAIRALYAFCRKTDDLVDREDATLADLEHWRAAVDLPPEQQTNPVLHVWARIREYYSINRQYEKDLIDGVAMDINRRVYHTWADLEDYCYHVASTVGLLSIPIIGLAPEASLEEAEKHAIQLGIALQLTNILRDIGEDAARGRVYIPAEDLTAFNLTRSDILHHVYDERFIELMKFEIARTRRLFKQSLPGIAHLNQAARPAVGAAALLYEAILNEIEKIDFRVHQQRAFTTLGKKLLMIPSILIKVNRLEKVK